MTNKKQPVIGIGYQGAGVKQLERILLNLSFCDSHWSLSGKICSKFVFMVTFWQNKLKICILHEKVI